MKTSYNCVIVYILFIGYVVSQNLNELDVNELAEKVQNGEFNESQVPIKEVIAGFKEKCDKAGHPEAFDEIQERQDELKSCLEEKLNASAINEELEEAKKTGSMDEVFAKYCKRYPDIMKCVEPIREVAQKCLEDKEIVALNQAINITQNIKDFACYKDGDRLAMFVAAGGMECIRLKQKEVEQCLNSTLSPRVPEGGLTFADIPTFLFDSKNCDDFDTIRLCITASLESCNDSTPANLVDAFLKYFKSVLPCKLNRYGESKNGGGSSVAIHFVASLLLVLPLLLVKLL